MKCCTFAFALLAVVAQAGPARGETPWKFGFARTDITPTEPIRLSGYGNRDKPFEGIDEPLFARAMAIQHADGPVNVLVSVDTIGFPSVLSKEIHDQVHERHGLERANFVIACTHSHTSPHIGRGLDNLFNVPLTDDERAKTETYTDFVRDRIVELVGAALRELTPGRLFTASGEAHFAVNRRVLQDGKWTGFGVNPQGPVDHSLPILKVTDETGEKVRAVLFNYACHCTTFGGDYNRVNGDWAGYAAKYLETAHDGAFALAMIGCGADANPQREPAKAFELAQAQGREISDEVERLLAGEMQEITAPLEASYGYAGLPIDRPSRDDLNQGLNNNRPQVRRHAEKMLEVWDRMGRLPETYPMPIQVWRCGDQFAMVFLGGEVCVDYATRIKRELGEEQGSRVEGQEAPLSTLHSPLSTPAWVSAYCNDVFGYVASERMRDEGGYEVDFSMIYYNQPGRWSSGTEDVILRRVRELFDRTVLEGPLSVKDALAAFTLPEGLAIDVVAAEPLITDPVNFAVGPDGRLWVVQMGDYPRGAHDDGAPGGKVRVLTDRDGDGRYDEAVTFLDGLVYPTGVFPWRNGALVTAAPDILFAADTDGDGVADERQVLYTGFVESNPQHRINGFCYGLDNWLYLGSGASSGDITCTRTGEVVNVSGRDSRIRPDAGLLQAETGETQYGRCRDDWGNWFGNNNSNPLYHFVLSDRDLRRNPFVASPKPVVHLPNPPSAPPVYPTSRTVDRFNDLFALDRFTSACSPIVFRDTTLGEDVYGAALICEPVHNLVSRLMLEADGVTFRGRRHPSEDKVEFLSSRDNWFRPTRLMTGPDGGLWVSDMYRMVIEHPQWIPEAWQQRINIYAGNDRGRIYRVYRREPSAVSGQPSAVRFDVPNLAAMSDLELVTELRSTNGWRRDTAQLLFVQRDEISADALRLLGAEALRPGAPGLSRVHALCTLDGRGALTPNHIANALRDADPRVVREAARIAGEHLPRAPQLVADLARLADHDDVRVRLQVVLALGASRDAGAAAVLARIAEQDLGDPWLRAAILSSAPGHAERLMAETLKRLSPSDDRNDFLTQLVATALGDEPQAGVARILDTITRPQPGGEQDWQLTALAACSDALARRNISLRKLSESDDPAIKAALKRADALFDKARTLARDEKAPTARRAMAAGVLTRAPDRTDEDLQALAGWLSPRVTTDLQSAAVDALVQSRDDNVPDLLLAEWRSTGPQLRAQVLQALLSRPAWTSALIARLKAGTVLPGDLDAASRSRLVEHRDEGIRGAAAELLGTSTSADRQKVIDDYRTVFDLTGDAKRGAAVFQKRCAACHKHHGIGNEIGAQLAALQNKSTDFLLTALLDPNRAAEAKFTSYTVATRDGRVFTGMIVDETATSITLAKSDGMRDVILRVDIEELSASGKSFMPEGLEKDLTPQDAADVISFVQAAEPPAE